MVYKDIIEFNKVPDWCPYTPEEISKYFEFDLNNSSALVKYKCVHCKRIKSRLLGGIRREIRNNIFTSLCTKCRGEVQRSRSEKFKILEIPKGFKYWFIENNKNIKDLENLLNRGLIKNIKVGNFLNRGIEYKCIRCNSILLSSISRIKTSIKNKKYTGFCKKCVSSVYNKVSLNEPRTQSRGYIIIQKSLVPEEHLYLFDWTKPVMIHRYRMAVKLNRPLMPNEIVHHIDGNKENNDISNLELWNDSHPPGQRVEDKIKWAKEILKLYKNYKS